jgi:hypothetical protein
MYLSLALSHLNGGLPYRFSPFYRVPCIAFWAMPTGCNMVYIAMTLQEREATEGTLKQDAGEHLEVGDGFVIAHSGFPSKFPCRQSYASRNQLNGCNTLSLAAKHAQSRVAYISLA